MSENIPEKPGASAPDGQQKPSRPRRRSRRSSSRRWQQRRRKPTGTETAETAAGEAQAASAPLPAEPAQTVSPAPDSDSELPPAAPITAPETENEPKAAAAETAGPVTPSERAPVPAKPRQAPASARPQSARTSDRRDNRSQPSSRGRGLLPDWYEAETVPGGIKSLKFPGLDAGQVRSRLLTFIRETMEHAGQPKVVLGLSGGVDSAVVASLLVEALGRDRVCLVFFIEADKTGYERSRADLVARLLKCQLEIQDLRSSVKAFGAKPGTSSDRSGRDRLARARMAALYTLAEARQALVAGSVNKTKRWLGAATPHGDLAYDFNPIGDLYQTQIAELARTLRVPKPVLERARTIPFGYQVGSHQKPEAAWREVDYYLYQMLDVKLSLSHLQKIGVNPEKLRWLYQRVRSSTGHRQTAPSADLQATYVPRAGGL